MQFRIWIIFLVASSALGAGGQPPPRGIGGVLSRETSVLARLPQGSAPLGESLFLSPDGWSLAFRAEMSGKETLVFNGMRGAPYDEISSPVFGPSGTVAYLGRRADELCLVLAGREMRRFPQGELISELQFHPGGRGLVYVHRSAKGSAVVVGDSVGRRFEEILEGTVRVRPVTGEVAYAASSAGKRFIVAGDLELASYEEVSPPLLGPRGRLAYLATRHSKQFVVDERGEGKPYDVVGDIRLNPHSGRVVYAGASGGEWRLVIDGVEGPPRGRITDICVNPQGSSVACSFERGRDHFVARDSTLEGPYETVVQGTMSFSQDGNHLAYEAEWHDEFFVVFDGREGPRYSDVVNGSIRMSPDGTHVAYLAEQDRQQFVIFDGTEGPRHQDARSLELSPIGQHFAYVATDDNRTRVVVDGVSGSPWDAVIGDQIHFDSELSLRYIARLGDRLYRVRETLNSDRQAPGSSRR